MGYRVSLKIWQMRATLPTILNFRAHLFTARNHCLNNLQKTKAVFTFYDDSFMLDTGVNDDNPRLELEFWETKQQVAAAFETLPPQCQLISVN